MNKTVLLIVKTLKRLLFSHKNAKTLKIVLVFVKMLKNNSFRLHIEDKNNYRLLHNMLTGVAFWINVENNKNSVELFCKTPLFLYVQAC